MRKLQSLRLQTRYASSKEKNYHDIALRLRLFLLAVHEGVIYKLESFATLRVTYELIYSNNTVIKKLRDQPALRIRIGAGGEPLILC